MGGETGSEDDAPACAARRLRDARAAAAALEAEVAAQERELDEARAALDERLRRCRARKEAAARARADLERALG